MKTQEGRKEGRLERNSYLKTKKEEKEVSGGDRRKQPPPSPLEELHPANKSRAAIAALRAAIAARVGFQSEISCSFAIFYLFILLSFVIRFRIV